MATSISDVSDLFLTKVNDYRLETIYTSSGSQALNIYVEPWLLGAISEFEGICNQSLEYTECTSNTEGEFAVDLTRENMNILAEIMVRFWLAKSIQDILQMNMFVQDHDFKTHSSAQNLKAKQDYYNTKREEISQMLTNYEYKYNDWANWKNGEWNV